MEKRAVMVVIDDFFFLTKVQTTLAHMDLAADVHTSAASLQGPLQSALPAGAIVDLTLRSDDAIAVIKAIRATPGGEKLPVLAFGSHVEVDRRQQAAAAGADQVVTKSEFSKRLPEFLQRFRT